MTMHLTNIGRAIYPTAFSLFFLMSACAQPGDDVLGNETIKALGTTPADGQLHVDPNAVIAVRFNRPLDLRTINQDSLQVFGPDGVSVRGWAEFDLDDGWLHFHPTAPLEAGYLYQGVVSPTVLDHQGFGFRQPMGWSWVVEGDAFPLALTGLSPTPKSENNPADADIELQFDQALSRNSLYDAFEVSADGEGWGIRVDTDPSRPDWIRLVTERDFESGAHVVVLGFDILNADGEGIQTIEFDFWVE